MVGCLVFPNGLMCVEVFICCVSMFGKGIGVNLRTELKWNLELRLENIQGSGDVINARIT